MPSPFAMISGLFIFPHKGDAIISRIYRDDIECVAFKPAVQLWFLERSAHLLYSSRFFYRHVRLDPRHLRAAMSGPCGRLTGAPALCLVRKMQSGLDRAHAANARRTANPWRMPSKSTLFTPGQAFAARSTRLPSAFTPRHTTTLADAAPVSRVRGALWASLSLARALSLFLSVFPPPSPLVSPFVSPSLVPPHALRVRECCRPPPAVLLSRRPPASIICPPSPSISLSLLCAHRLPPFHDASCMLPLGRVCSSGGTGDLVCISTVRGFPTGVNAPPPFSCLALHHQKTLLPRPEEQPVPRRCDLPGTRNRPALRCPSLASWSCRPCSCRLLNCPRCATRTRIG